MRVHENGLARRAWRQQQADGRWHAREHVRKHEGMAVSARHACALAGARQRAFFRACARERAASAGCGGLASERVRGEPGAVWRHGLEGGIFWLLWLHLCHHHNGCASDLKLV